MSNLSLILIGAGGHARACIDVIEQNGDFKIFGLVGLESELGSEVNGYEVMATDKDLKELAQKVSHALVTVGQIVSPKVRISLYDKAKDAGFELPKIVSRLAYVSPSSQIGPGTIIMHGAIINSGVKVGQNCIINTRSVLEHDSQIHDNCHVSTGVIVNGGAVIREGCFVGSGSSIREGVSIGEHSIIGMGSSVRHNLNANSTFQGSVTS
jgi:sugar O-acyltransferase (sialic acid O-acetyltransferase NeuD family)